MTYNVFGGTLNLAQLNLKSKLADSHRLTHFNEVWRDDR